MNPGKCKSPAAAFTLVELLVVMGSMVVLIAILLAAVAGVHKAAARTVCANNLRQMWPGFFAYNQEFHRLPGSEAHKTTSDLPSYFEMLRKRQDYPAKLFICPTNASDSPTNYDLDLKVVGWPLNKGRADTVLAAESGTCIQCHEQSNKGFGHGPLVNHLFFDGHVESSPRSVEKPRPSGGQPMPG